MGDKKGVKKTKVRVALEIPKSRRMAIEEAMSSHEPEHHPEWDRGAEWKDVRFYRKRVKPGTLRTTNRAKCVYSSIEQLFYRYW